jgi:predicted membrane protein
VVVFLFYGIVLAILVPRSHGGLAFATIGRMFARRHVAGTALKLGPPYANMGGYDGQFNYYIALDPVRARPYIDVPSYRYGRILYPMLARALAFGQSALIPYALILINWLALSGGTLAVAALLRRRGVSPWFALIYGLYPGLVFSLRRDLTEPLAFSLVALAIYLFDLGERRRYGWAGIGFALATLTRESCAVFGVTYAAVTLFQDGRGMSVTSRLVANWRPAALLLGLTLGPFALYQLFLLYWLGMHSVPETVMPTMIPFAGIMAYWPWRRIALEQVALVTLPGLICGGMALWALWKRVWDVEVWSLLVNVLAFIVFLNASSYATTDSTLRVTTGVILAALVCLPVLDSVTGRWRLWLWACTVLWMVLFPFILASVSPFGTLRSIASAVARFVWRLLHHG